MGDVAQPAGSAPRLPDFPKEYQLTGGTNYAQWNEAINVHTLMGPSFLRASLFPDEAGADAVGAPTALEHKKALVWLWTTVGINLRGGIMSNTTGADAMASLRGICVPQTRKLKMAFSSELITVKQRATENVAAYIARAQQLHSQLLAAGGTMTEEEAVVSVLRGLLPFFAMDSHFFAHDPQPMSFARALIYFETAERVTRAGDAVKGTKPSGGAGATAPDDTVTVAAVQVFKDKCNYCKIPGHKERNCRKKQRDMANGQVKPEGWDRAVPGRLGRQYALAADYEVNHVHYVKGGNEYAF